MREMKDSGIEWIGGIPSSWNMIRLKNCIATRNGGAWGDEPGRDEKDCICFRVADIDYDLLRLRQSSQLTIRSYKEKVFNQLLLRKGDILIEKSGGGEKTPVGRAVLFDKDCEALFANFLERIRTNDSVCPEFLLYILSTFYDTQYICKYIKQTTGIQNLDISGMLSSVMIATPDIITQKRIADYLDSKCSQIDSIIEKQKQIIEKLKEYKTSLITEVVTKGLDPNAEMKDSHSMWFGSIPKHWSMKRLKYVFHIQKDIAGKEGYTVLSITQRGIVPKDFSKNEGQFANSYANYQLVHVGDFAMNHMDLLTGWVDISKYEGVTSPDYRVFVLDDKINNCSEYYLYMMQMCYSQKIFYGLGAGVSDKGRWRLQADKFLNFMIPMPSLEEQRQIVKFLRHKEITINKSIEAREKAIEKLQEYKKSLIYEVVTGKREV